MGRAAVMAFSRATTVVGVVLGLLAPGAHPLLPVVAGVRRALAGRAAVAQDSSQPSWLTPVAAPPEPEDTTAATPLDSSPPWLRQDAATGWGTLPPLPASPVPAPEAASSAPGTPTKPLPVTDAVQKIPTVPLSRAYLTSGLVWAGASLDALFAREFAVAGSFALAASAATCLASATKGERLASATYRRLNLAFFIFGFLHALARVATPAAFAAHTVAALSCFVGLALAGLPDFGTPQEGKDRVPVLATLYASLGGVAAPLAACAAAVLATPVLGSAQIALAGLAVAGASGVLEDAAKRRRLAASTFRRLNLALAAAATGVAATLWRLLGGDGANLAAETVVLGRWVVSLSLPEPVLRLLAVLSLYCAGLAFFEGAKAVVAEKKL